MQSESADLKAYNKHKWAHSLFQNPGVGIAHEPWNSPPSIESASDGGSVTQFNTSRAVVPNPLNWADGCGASHASDSCSMNSIGDGTFGARAKTAPKKAIASASVSRLAFPFNKSARPKPSPPKSPPGRAPSPSPAPTSRVPQARPKYSCLPSPLSSGEIEQASRKVYPFGHPSSPSPRHAYRHHGYSRQALFHTKWFWSTREEKWHGLDQKSGKSDLSISPASTDITMIPKTSMHPPNFLRRMRSFYETEQPSAIPPLTVYPRRGDIAALRDPYCVYIDRRFAKLPSWSIGKIIWMHELHALSADKVLEQFDDSQTEVDDESLDEVTSEVSFGTSYSLGVSDDSDTLVDSESEWEVASVSKWTDGSHSNISKSGASSSFLLEPESAVPQDAVSWLQHVYIIGPSALSILRTQTLPNNWYRRWGILLEMSRRCQPQPERPQLEVFKSPTPRPIRRKAVPFEWPCKPVLPPKPSKPVDKRGKYATDAPERCRTIVVQACFITPSHPAAG